MEKHFHAPNGAHMSVNTERKTKSGTSPIPCCHSWSFHLQTGVQCGTLSPLRNHSYRDLWLWCRFFFFVRKSWLKNSLLRICSKVEAEGTRRSTFRSMNNKITQCLCNRKLAPCFWPTVSPAVVLLCRPKVEQSSSPHVCFKRVFAKHKVNYVVLTIGGNLLSINAPSVV